MLQRGIFPYDHMCISHQAATSNWPRHGTIVHQRRRTTAKTQSLPRRLHLQESGKLPWQQSTVDGDDAAQDSISSAMGALAPRVPQSADLTPSNDLPNSDSDQRLAESAPIPAAVMNSSDAYDKAVAALASAEAEANVELAASKQEAKQKRLQQKARRERVLETKELVELAGRPTQVAQQRLDARDARSRSYWVRSVSARPRRHRPESDDQTTMIT